MINFALAAGPETINGKSEAAVLPQTNDPMSDARPQVLTTQQKFSSTSSQKPVKARLARKTQEPARDPKPAGTKAALTSSSAEMIPEHVNQSAPATNSIAALAAQPPFSRKCHYSALYFPLTCACTF